MRGAAQGNRHVEHGFRLRRGFGLRPGGSGGGIGRGAEAGEAVSGSSSGLAAATRSAVGGTVEGGRVGRAQKGTGSPLEKGINHF